MKIVVINTERGFVPDGDTDYDEKKKLTLGKAYEVTIKELRNYKFHRKYFALINCAWEYQNEVFREGYRNSKEVFRKSIELCAGNCEPIYSIERKEWIEQVKSISFDKMDETEFKELYNSVRDVIYKLLLPYISIQEFEKNLINFLR